MKLSTIKGFGDNGKFVLKAILENGTEAAAQGTPLQIEEKGIKQLRTGDDLKIRDLGTANG